MSKRTLTAHINCSPWIEDGKWNITLSDRYFSVFAFDDDDSERFSAIDNLLEEALDRGIIDSYYIKRAGEPEPKVHAPNGTNRTYPE